MRLRILGCSGGIGGRLRTTSMLLDENILIDAGTGVGDLSLEELKKIDHVFVTHSHLDHVAYIPFLVDTVGWMRSDPVTVHATPATLEILKEHLFNWKIWPDFSCIPDPDIPYMRYGHLEVGETVDLNGRKITPLPAHHVVPAVGFRLESRSASLIFSGDTTTNDALWEWVNRTRNLRYLIIETAFGDGERDLAIASKHLCPSLLREELKKIELEVKPEIYITHLKPGESDSILEEIEAAVEGFCVKRLENNQVFEF
ncbi:3',5'-cyclic-nucleotide phosphodiesterase [Pelomicrobium sp. G1]|uniref:3',5'-cyclic-nucleotide phosphodiesterase n=1 Tax=unclassified Pelomicrobium TaxID=2815318 RepID=UPI000A768B9F